MSKREKDNDRKCGPGQIMRKGYYRKGYDRAAYQRRSGKSIPSAHVSSAYVPPTCIKDLGKPGHGPKTLPPLTGDIHLTKYGYKIHKSANERHAALKAASKSYGALPVLRHLNLIRNYQVVPENKDIFSDDVEYMERLYANSKNHQTGGHDTTSDGSVIDIDPTSATSPDRAVDIEQTVCSNDGDCQTEKHLFETHNINNKRVLLYTLDEKDADTILELDKKFIDPDQSRETVIKKIKDNHDRVIGIKADNALQGYCIYDIAAPRTAQIVWFTADKGYGKALYLFTERYLKRNGYTRVIVIITLDGPNTINRLNFWYGEGYSAFEDHLVDDKQIYMDKNI